jgi:hypothetical protein
METVTMTTGQERTPLMEKRAGGRSRVMKASSRQTEQE